MTELQIGPQNRRVAGYCPMGCGQTLFTAPTEAGPPEIACSDIDCPKPTAAATILGDPEQHHIVQLNATSFDTQNPLKERLDGGLTRCHLQHWINTQGGPPHPLGTYRVRNEPDVTLDDGTSWTWELLEATNA